MFGLNAMNKVHPLDKLITDDSLWLLEAVVAFVDYPFKRMLVMLIKYKEVMSILNCLDDRNYISDCGFDCHPKCTEDMINDMCKFMPGDFSSTIKNMNKMMNMMNTMNSMNMTTAANEGDNFTNNLSHLFNTNNSDASKNTLNESNTTDSSDGESLYDSIINILDNNK